MPIKNTSAEYGWVAIIFHWLSAIVIIGLFALGWWMTGLDYYDPWYKFAPDLHRSIGVLLVAATVLRLLWRKLNPVPVAERGPRWQLTLATGVHYSFYILIFLMLPTGYLITTAEGQPLEVFNWFAMPALVTDIDNIEDIAGAVHKYLAYSLIALALLHAAAAFKHHFVDKDATLKKMLGRLR